MERELTINSDRNTTKSRRTHLRPLPRLTMDFSLSVTGRQTTREELTFVAQVLPLSPTVKRMPGLCSMDGGVLRGGCQFAVSQLHVPSRSKPDSKTNLIL